MAVAIAAAPNLTGNPCADLTVTGLTATIGSTLTIVRSWAGESAPVRSAQSATLTGTTMIAQDTECPFGIPVSYAVTVYNASGAIVGQASTSVTLDVDRVWISDALAPGTAAAVRLHTEALAQLTYSRQGQVSGVLGSSLPVGVLGPRLVAARVPLDLSCHTAAEEAAALAVLIQADPVCVRVPAADKYRQLPALCYVTADDVVLQPLDAQSGGGHSRIGLTVSLVRAPSIPVVVSTRTLADLMDEAGTLGDLAALYGTLLDLQRGT